MFATATRNVRSSLVKRDRNGDVLLLCTDGLSGLVPNDEIADVIYQYGDEPKSRRVARAIVAARPITVERVLNDTGLLLLIGLGVYAGFGVWRGNYYAVEVMNYILSGSGASRPGDRFGTWKAVPGAEPVGERRAIVEALRRGCRYVGAVGSRKTQGDRRARLIEAVTDAAVGVATVSGPPLAWYDNTKANKNNPDPEQWVGYGDRTVDEPHANRLRRGRGLLFHERDEFGELADAELRGPLVDLVVPRVLRLRHVGEQQFDDHLLRRARARGIDVRADQYAYTAASSGLGIRFPSWALEGGQKATSERLAAPDERGRVLRGRQEYALEPLERLGRREVIR